jgi:hypothetical protein
MLFCILPINLRAQGCKYFTAAKGSVGEAEFFNRIQESGRSLTMHRTGAFHSGLILLAWLLDDSATGSCRKWERIRVRIRTCKPKIIFIVLRISEGIEDPHSKDSTKDIYEIANIYARCIW